MRRAIRSSALAIVCIAWVAPSAAQAQQPTPSTAQAPNMPLLLQRGSPGRGHALLQPLEGTFRVEMSVYMAIGTPDHPVVSTDAICRRTWVGDRRYLHDVTEGTLAGSHYYREGLLGFSNVDQRYEWVTVDAANANMMIYRGQDGSGPRLPIEMTGVFTDQGWLGERTVGKAVRIESNDRHVFELYFTPPGGRERLVDRKIYTRITG
jgi:hypothetical protein